MSVTRFSLLRLCYIFRYGLFSRIMITSYRNLLRFCNNVTMYHARENILCPAIIHALAVRYAHSVCAYALAREGLR